MNKEQATCELGKAIGEMTGALIVDFIKYALDTTNAKNLKKDREQLQLFERNRIETLEKIAALHWYNFIKRYNLVDHLNWVNEEIAHLKERIAHLEQIVPEKMR